MPTKRLIELDGLPVVGLRRKQVGVRLEGLARTFRLPVRIPRRELIRCTVSVLRGFEITRIDSHHLQRRPLTPLSGHKNHRRDAAIDGKRQFFNQFLIGHDPIVTRRQNTIDTFQLEWMPEHHRFAERTNGHR
jgi:hypothetical protein